MQDVESKDPVAVIGDVNYEMSQLRYAAEAIKDCPKNTKPFNALLESFLIHARNLHDFFFEEGMNPNDDVFVRHYLATDKLEAFRRTRGNAILDKTKVNKLLAHITFSRAAYVNNKGWPAQEIFQQLMTIAMQFHQCLSPENKKLFTEFSQ